MNITFQKARKSQAKARVANIGPSGSGKTLLGLFTGQKLGNKIAVIDTENGSASKYADRFDFDVLNLDDFDPRTYIAALQAAVQMLASMSGVPPPMNGSATVRPDKLFDS